MGQKKEICIVYIITTLELGGAQKVCLALHEGVKASGNRSFIICGSQGALAATISRSTDTIILDTLVRELAVSQFFVEIKNFINLIRQLKKIKKEYPQVTVHTHSTKAGLVGRWAAFFAGIKKRVHTVHGYAFHAHQNKISWLIIYALELITSFITTHYVCVSSHDVKIGIKLFPKFTHKHSIIRAGVNQQQFFIPSRKEVTPPKDRPFIFGTISCFKKQKNIFDLLAAFESVHKKNNQTRLELIGDGTLRKPIEQWIADRNLATVITVHGWLLEPAPIMENWHAFVLSSLWEGLPCAIVEARLLKLPVLSYNTGGICDVIQSGENGFLYPQGNWPALADGMLALSQNPDLYQKLSKAQDKLEDFDDKFMVNQHLTLYRMAGKGNSPGM